MCADLANRLRSFNVYLPEQSPFLGLPSEAEFALYQPQNDTLGVLLLTDHEPCLLCNPSERHFPTDIVQHLGMRFSFACLQCCSST